MSATSTMMDVPLTTTWILERATRDFADRDIVSRSDEGPLFRYTYGAFARRVARLAHALVELGVRPGDRVASFGWNTHRHLELYFAVPSIGAVLHTTNIRLFPEQVCWMFEHAGDRFVFVDGALAPAIARTLEARPGFSRPFVVMGEARGELPGALDYENLLSGRPDSFDWPQLDERTAAILCYTSATTGDPKGVLFSHRSTVLHAFAAGLADALGVSVQDTVLPVVPMFHVNAWGIPFLAPLVGAKLVLPGAALDPQSLIALLDEEGVTIAAGVPTVWLAVRDELVRLRHTPRTLRTLVIGGSAVPPSLFDDLRSRGVDVVHAWGMTEMSPIGTVNRLRPELDAASEFEQRAARLKQGLFTPLVAWRLLDERGGEVPHDGVAQGELWVRGPAVTSGYFREERPSDAVRDGYFRTGDICTVDALGYLEVVDRAKDLVKSGGEWISTVALENALMGHPAILEAAVIGVPHARWQERPVAVCVVRDGQAADESAVRAWLSMRVAKWWVPDRVVFVDALPRTGVGKFLKRELRERYRALLTEE